MKKQTNKFQYFSVFQLLWPAFRDAVCVCASGFQSVISVSFASDTDTVQSSYVHLGKTRLYKYMNTVSNDFI